MVEKIKVLAITNIYPTEKNPADTPAIKDQLDALKEIGVEVELLHINGERVFKYFLAAWRVFLLNFKSQKYDLVHAYYGHSGLAALFQRRYPVIITYLGSDILHYREKYLGKITSRLANSIIVMSEEMKRVSGRKDAHVIPSGINTEVFKPMPIDQARQVAGLPINKKLVLFPWNPDRPVKRFDIVSKAIQILKESTPEIELITIYQNPPKVVAQFMNACDVLVLASDHEGSPVAVREAMACNLPIVSVDVGDVKEVIRNTKSCTITTRDSHEIASALEKILSKGERSDGATKITDDSALQAAQKVLVVYQSILGSESHPPTKGF